MGTPALSYQQPPASVTSIASEPSSATRPTSFTLDALSSRQRAVVILGTVVASIAHIPVIGPHLNEAPYMGVLFIVLTAAWAALAATVLVRDSCATYALVVLTSGLAVFGYAATRLVAFPMLSDDVGNWLEPLGVVSIASETVAAAAAICALLEHRVGAAPRGRIR